MGTQWVPLACDLGQKGFQPNIKNFFGETSSLKRRGELYLRERFVWPLMKSMENLDASIEVFDGKVFLDDDDGDVLTMTKLESSPK